MEKLEKMKIKDACKMMSAMAREYAMNEVNLFCHIMGFPKNDHNYLIADDPHGVVDIQEGYMCFNMSDVHVLLSEYSHWLDIYKSDEEIAKVVKQWYYWSLDWHNNHREFEWMDASKYHPDQTKGKRIAEDEKDKIVLVAHSGYAASAYLNCDGVWVSSDGGLLQDVTHWVQCLPVPDKAPCCNLKSWLMGWRPDPEDILPQWKEHREKELTAAQARLEAAEEELKKAIKDVENAGF